MIVRSRLLVTMDGPPIENGGVVIDGKSIVAVGPAEEMARLDGGEVVDLGEMVLMPGLINAHCHLDYTMMRHSISPPKSFTAWVQRINALKRSLDEDDYLQAIDRGFKELQTWGVTSVCNIEAFPELMRRMGKPPIRTWWFYEMIDVRHRIPTDELIQGALRFFGDAPDSLTRFGISPHAPYTASEQLYEMANICADSFSLLLTTHVAESREEAAMFARQEGDLYEFMSSIGRPMEDCRGNSSFSRLWRSGAIDRNWLLVHMNELSEEDYQILAQCGAEGPSVVHCPGSHAYFGHSPFPYRRLAELGINICIGTDSLASTNSLSLLLELRRLREVEPWLPAVDLLRTITVNPALAVQRPGRLGQIRPGAFADLIALPIEPDAAQVYDQIVDFDRPVPWMMVDGKIKP